MLASERRVFMRVHWSRRRYSRPRFNDAHGFFFQTALNAGNRL